MALSGLKQSINENGTGATTPTSDGVACFIGYSTLGTAETVISIGDSSLVEKKLGFGPMSQAVACKLSMAGGVAYAIPVVSDVAGTVGTITKVGTGTPVLTAAGTPNDNTQFVIKIVAGGAVATATFQYSIDNGLSYSPVILTATTYLIPNTGITVSFPVGSYVAGDTYSFTTTAPGYSSTKAQSAFNALVNSGVKVECVYFVGQPADLTAAASLAVAVNTMLETEFAKSNIMHAYIEIPDGTDEAINTAFANVNAPHVVPCIGYCDIMQPTNSKQIKRPSAFATVAKAMAIPVSEELGYVGSKKQNNLVMKLYRDERLTPGLSDRFTVLRTRNEKAGFFYEVAKTLASAGSDLQKLRYRRVLNKAVEICGKILINHVNERLKLEKNGTLSDAARDIIQGEVISALQAGIGDSVSAFEFVISQANNMNLDPTLNCRVRYLPFGYAENIVVEHSFTKSLAA